MLHETRKQFIEPRGHDSSNNKASATPRFRRRRERGVATREWGGVDEKNGKKISWWRVAQPLRCPSDRLPRRLPTTTLCLRRLSRRINERTFGYCTHLSLPLSSLPFLLLLSLVPTNPSPPHQTLQIRTRKQNRKAHRCADPCTNVRTCKQPSCSFPFENQWSRCACACTNAIYRLPQRYRFLSVLTHEPFSLDAREHTSVEHRDSPIRSIDPSPSSIVFLDSSRERRPIVRGPNDRLPAAGGTRCLPPCSSLDRKSILLRNPW